MRTYLSHGDALNLDRMLEILPSRSVGEVIYPCHHRRWSCFASSTPARSSDDISFTPHQAYRCLAWCVLKTSHCKTSSTHFRQACILAIATTIPSSPQPVNNREAGTAFQRAYSSPPPTTTTMLCWQHVSNLHRPSRHYPSSTPRSRPQTRNLLLGGRGNGDANPLSDWTRHLEPSRHRTLLQQRHPLQERVHVQPPSTDGRTSNLKRRLPYESEPRPPNRRH